MNEPEIIALLRELVEIESPTGSAGVRVVAERMAAELEAAGGRTRFLDDHLQADFPGAGAPVLLLGHTDTVWELGTLERMPFSLADGKAGGPGVYDMKGGLAIMAAALHAAGPERRAVRVFLTADEEQGSRTAKPLLPSVVEGVAAAFVLEPALPRGGLKTARKGLGRFWLPGRGRAAPFRTSS